jgi:putative transposase
MGHTYATNLVHIVFSTKERRVSIPSHKLHELWAYLQGIARNLKAETLAIGGISDHVHILVSVPKSMALSDLVMKLKANSSKWMGPNFAWQEGYRAFSVSSSNIDAVQKYIRSQAEHHRKRDFREEFRILLERSGIKFDQADVFR